VSSQNTARQGILPKHPGLCLDTFNCEGGTYSDGIPDPTPPPRPCGTRDGGGWAHLVHEGREGRYQSLRSLGICGGRGEGERVVPVVRGALTTPLRWGQGFTCKLPK